GARDLEPRHLPGAARARQRVVGARPGGGGARRRLPPAAHHDRRAGGTLGPPRPARRLPARGARVPPDAVSRRLRPALVLGILVAGCGVSPATTQVELRAYLVRTKSWAPVAAEANRTIKRILATQFVDEAERAAGRPRLILLPEGAIDRALRARDPGEPVASVSAGPAVIRRVGRAGGILQTPARLARAVARQELGQDLGARPGVVGDVPLELGEIEEPPPHEPVKLQ